MVIFFSQSKVSFLFQSFSYIVKWPQIASPAFYIFKLSSDPQAAPKREGTHGVNLFHTFSSPPADPFLDANLSGGGGMSAKSKINLYM